jgi:hypothetical protein
MVLRPKSKSFHAKVYKSTYGCDRLPNNLCGYFWANVLAFLLLIPSFPGHIINMIRRNNDVQSIWTAIHFPLALLIGSLLVDEKKMKAGTTSLWTLYGWGMLLILSMVVGIFLTALVVFWVNEMQEKRMWKKYYKLQKEYPEMHSGQIWEMIEADKYRKLERRKKRFLIIEWFKAFKGKYCPKLEWD